MKKELRTEGREEEEAKRTMVSERNFQRGEGIRGRSTSGR